MPKGQSASSSEPLIPKLIVGLGNPEPKYDRTRHNIGFEVIDELAKVWGISLSENRRFNALAGEGRSPFGKIYLLKPLTYMNRSGQAIRAAIDWYKLPPESVLTIYDDMDLPLGRLRLRETGSAGGHNGMKSTIAHLGTQDFPRLRLGIGRPRVVSGETVSHVLGKFAPEEQPTVQALLRLSVETIERSLRDGVAKAASLYNNRDVAPPKPKPAPAPATPETPDRAPQDPQPVS
ncbi:MAG: aminoacyl-tRNA hydrolase [Limnothrix sp. CACIAM 69d]|nr:MAG: aminoacyl-tRNA hydrolase [Limnothrix sp. CACIAM 69d]